jgi:hypothetical protein
MVTKSQIIFEAVLEEVSEDIETIKKPVKILSLMNNLIHIFYFLNEEKYS